MENGRVTVSPVIDMRAAEHAILLAIACAARDFDKTLSPSIESTERTILQTLLVTAGIS